MLKLRTDTKYVTPDGKLTQAGVEAFQGLLDAQAASIATNAASIATNAADIAALEAIAISSAPGAAPRYACRAWVNFNGTGTPSIRASGNVSSITDLGIGHYGVNFAVPMPDNNYVGVGTLDTLSLDRFLIKIFTDTVNRATVSTMQSGAVADFALIHVAIFR